MSMVVMAREDWTDARIDDFKENVSQRFDQVDKRFDEVDKRFDRVEADIRGMRVEMKQGFERIDKRFEAIDNKFVGIDNKFDGKFDSLQRTMIIGFVTLFASIAASVIGAFIAVLFLV